MRFFLVDVKAIKSTQTQEQFDKTKLEQLADSIIECNGLLKPLILKQTTPESYSVLAGDFEFFAAVRAREKDPRKCEMVNAFVIANKEQENIVKQIKIINF